MISVYFLPVIIANGVEQVAGIEYIHDALLETTDDPMVRKLTQDTNQVEYDHLYPLSMEAYDATQEEIDLYHAVVIIPPVDPYYIRACEILSNPAIPIPAPHLAELVRIFGRRLGYDF